MPAGPRTHVIISTSEFPVIVSEDVKIQSVQVEDEESIIIETGSILSVGPG